MGACQTIHLPPGVKHHVTSAVAETWEAWDALQWEERSWWVDQDGTTRRHTQKEAVIDGHRIVVFPPVKGRAEVAA